MVDRAAAIVLLFLDPVSNIHEFQIGSVHEVFSEEAAVETIEKRCQKCWIYVIVKVH
jgi:hypothetical protein